MCVLLQRGNAVRVDDSVALEVAGQPAVQTAGGLLSAAAGVRRIGPECRPRNRRLHNTSNALFSGRYTERSRSASATQRPASRTWESISSATESSSATTSLICRRATRLGGSRYLPYCGDETSQRTPPAIPRNAGSLLANAYGYERAPLSTSASDPAVAVTCFRQRAMTSHRVYFTQCAGAITMPSLL